MPEITVELVAILAYTAFALFLSLYFVPFKIVPKAWAKAVRTEGHPAKLALTAVLDEAAPKVAAAVVLPTFPKLEEIAKAVAVDPSGFKLQIDLEPVRTIVREEITAFENRRKMVGVREARGAAVEGDAERVQQAAANPEGASMLQFAIRALDGMANNKIIAKATAKSYIAQLKDEFAASGDITNLANSFGVNLAGFVPGGAPSVAVRTKGGPI